MSQNANALPAPFGELLGNAAWTRRLARSLVGSDADDLVQDAWLAAMRRPPDTSRPIQPWLATVVRNAAFNRSRDGARRLERETRTEAPQALETAEELLARLEVHKILVETVGALVEPYRQTVVLAYFDGLSSREIGERQNVPPGTVRDRLKTALELLREALDERLGGRGAWQASVVNLAQGTAHGPSILAPAGGAANGGVASRGSGASSATTAVGAPSAVGELSAVLGVVVVVATGATLWKVTRPPSAAPTTDAVGVYASRSLGDGSPSSTTSLGSSAGASSTMGGGPAQRLSALVVADRDQLRRYPTVPTRPLAPPPPSSTVGAFPLIAADVARAKDKGPCKIATKGDTPTAKACAKGGRREATKLMKMMVKQAKANGENFTCDGCHRDLDGFELTKNASADYVKLEALSKINPKREYEGAGSRTMPAP
jgi:RNA polymerase sigma factor (sigma-70 family)